MRRDRKVAEERAQAVLKRINAPKRKRSEIVKPDFYVRRYKTQVRSHQILKKRVQF
jgi:hypothetical protein